MVTKFPITLRVVLEDEVEKNRYIKIYSIVDS